MNDNNNVLIIDASKELEYRFSKIDPLEHFYLTDIKDTTSKYKKLVVVKKSDIEIKIYPAKYKYKRYAIETIYTGEKDEIQAILDKTLRRFFSLGNKEMQIVDLDKLSSEIVRRIKGKYGELDIYTEEKVRKELERVYFSEKSLKSKIKELNGATLDEIKICIVSTSDEEYEAIFKQNFNVFSTKPL